MAQRLREQDLFTKVFSMKKDTDNVHPSSAFTGFTNKLHLRKEKRQVDLNKNLVRKKSQIYI